MQKIIQFALGSRLLVLALGTLVVAAGWWTYQRLPIDAFPDSSVCTTRREEPGT